MAIEQAKIAQSAGEVPVGAVLLGPFAMSWQSQETELENSKTPQPTLKY